MLLAWEQTDSQRVRIDRLRTVRGYETNDYQADNCNATLHFVVIERTMLTVFMETNTALESLLKRISILAIWSFLKVFMVLLESNTALVWFSGKVSQVWETSVGTKGVNTKQTTFDFVVRNEQRFWSRHSNILRSSSPWCFRKQITS